MDAELLTVGTELMLGLTADTNSVEMARRLSEAGIRVRLVTSVPDEEPAVRDAVRAALERSGTVIVSGGLGPTADDVTRAAVAQALGRRLVRDGSLVEALRERYRARGIAEMPSSNAAQADLVEGAAVLANPRGTAPGQWIEVGEKLVVLLPGVPKELVGLFTDDVVPRLLERSRRTGGEADVVTRSRTLRTAGIPESALADRLGDAAGRLGSGVTLAFLPSLAGVDLRVTAWQMPEGQARDVLDRSAATLRGLLGENCYGEGDDDLAAVVLSKLEEHGARLSVAESCTAGLLAARLTAVPGSSRAFAGGVVAYDNDLKMGFLGVSADALAEHGAVSEEVARQMASGIARATGTEAAVAITGIAGPDGGTEAKPVGTVWLAVSWRGATRVFSYLFPGDREDVRARAAQWALHRMHLAVAGSG